MYLYYMIKQKVITINIKINVIDNYFNNYTYSKNTKL